jgi:hypothetical protein
MTKRLKIHILRHIKAILFKRKDYFSLLFFNFVAHIYSSLWRVVHNKTSKRQRIELLCRSLIWSLKFITRNTLPNVTTPKDERKAHCVEVTFNALPEVELPIEAGNSHTGVSTRNAQSATSIPLQKSENLHWYALRTTYGREKKAFDYIIANNGIAFWPTITVVKRDINGKKKAVLESRIPNVLFAYGTEEDIKNFVYDNVHLPFLRFYYRHYHVGNEVHKEPLIVPDKQMESLKIICSANAEDIKIVPEEMKKFELGQLVRVINGSFKGVEGHVARWQGQQRIGVIIEGLLTISTAYVPSAFLQEI